MPTLSIDIEARFAQAIDAVDKLTKNVEKNGKRMESAFADVRKAAGLFGVALSAGAFAAFIKHSIDAQDKLNDLSKTTGVAVETLGGLGFAAEQAGTDLEGVAQSFGKLNLNIAKAAAGNEEAAAGFKALGLSLRDANGRLKTADVLLLEVADKFQKYADGPNKAALGNALFGKSYASILPLLAEGGRKIQQNVDYWKQFSGVSAKSAADADELNDQLSKMNLHLTALGNKIANELTKPLLTAAEAITLFEEKTQIFESFAKAIGEVFKTMLVVGANVSYVFNQIGEDTAAMVLRMKALAQLDFDLAQGILDEARERAAANRKAIDDFSDRVLNAPKTPAVPKTTDGKKTEAPGLPDKNEADKALALRKEALDAQLKALDAFAAESADILKQHNDDSERLYDANEIGLRRYFERLEQDRAEALNKQRTALQAEQDALRDFAGDTSVPAKDRLEATEKLIAVTARLAKVQRESGEAGAKAFADEKKAADALFDQITEINAQLLENQGKTAEAAALRREVADRALRRSLTVNAPLNLPQLDAIEAAANAHNQLNEALVVSDRRLAELGRAEREIQNELINGSITTLDALEKTDAARKKAVADLEREIPLLREKARLSGDPVDAEALKEAEQRLRDLAAASNQVKNQMRGLFQESLVDPLIDVVNHTKSADEAMKSFFNNIAQALLRLAAQQVSEKIFGSIFGMFGGGGSVVRQAGFSSADGNIMTEHGPLKLQRYARGGITNRPVLSLAGESGPEAIIPLPDGRAVPVVLKGLDRAMLTPAIPPTLTQTQRGPKGQQGGGSAVVLQIHPDAMHMTLRDWFEGELARTAATR